MDALAHNYSVAKQLAPRSQALAVIKADGYGHGCGPRGARPAAC
ncbi:MAG: alanine racemase [Rivihabitans pingtungensis]